MSLLTLLTMVFVLSIVWGGFVAALVLALKKEKGKRIEASHEKGGTHIHS